MKTRQVFNANTQQIESATVTIDINGDFIFAFADGSFFKLPGHLDKRQINKALDEHEKENSGKVILANLEKENAKKLDRV